MRSPAARRPQSRRVVSACSSASSRRRRRTTRPLAAVHRRTDWRRQRSRQTLLQRKQSVIMHTRGHKNAEIKLKGRNLISVALNSYHSHGRFSAS